MVTILSFVSLLCRTCLCRKSRVSPTTGRVSFCQVRSNILLLRSAKASDPAESNAGRLAGGPGALWEVVQELQLGENHLRDFLDWCEEIVLRDGGTVAGLLSQPELRQPLEAKLGRNDKLKAIKAR